MSGFLVPVGPLFAEVDADDYEAISGYRWYLSKSGYAVTDIQRDGNRERISMHRLVKGLARLDGREIDHVNTLKLDNRKSNLREVSRTENMCNRATRRDSKTGRKGVTWCTRKLKFRARIRLHGVQTSLGYYDDIEDAASAYKAASAELHGAFARS